MGLHVHVEERLHMLQYESTDLDSGSWLSVTRSPRPVADSFFPASCRGEMEMAVDVASITFPEQKECRKGHLRCKQNLEDTCIRE